MILVAEFKNTNTDKLRAMLKIFFQQTKGKYIFPEKYCGNHFIMNHICFFLIENKFITYKTKFPLSSIL